MNAEVTNVATFSGEDLVMVREEWTALVAVRLELLCAPCRLWLTAWASCERGFGQMVDEDLSRVRLGHYLGWHGHAPVADGPLAISSAELSAGHPSS